MRRLLAVICGLGVAQALADSRTFTLTPDFSGASQVQLTLQDNRWQAQLSGGDGRSQSLADVCQPELGQVQVRDVFTVRGDKDYLVVQCAAVVAHPGFEYYALNGLVFQAGVYFWDNGALVRDARASLALSGYEGNMTENWSQHHWYHTQPLARQKLLEQVRGHERDSLKLAREIVLARLAIEDRDAVYTYLDIELPRLLREEPLNAQTAALYNDLGYALQQGEWHSAAYELFAKVEGVVPQRVVLKLNIADSLWALYKRKQAAEYYRSYVQAMNSAGKPGIIPERARARSQEPQS
jgi:hypothetical protein